MASIFSKIIAGDIPSYKVAEDDKHYAFLDINPLAKGHTLVVPKHEVDYAFDLSEEEYAALHAFARRVAIAQKKAIPCMRVGVAILGFDVPHTHIHLVPLQSEGQMNFTNERAKFSPEEMAEIAVSIAKEFK